MFCVLRQMLSVSLKFTPVFTSEVRFYVLCLATIVVYVFLKLTHSFY
jgi:hypothetical protein